MTLCQTGCILGVEKDERARNGRLESTKQIRGIVNTMYIGHCCSLLRFPFPAVSFLYMREQAYNSLKTVGVAEPKREKSARS